MSLYLLAFIAGELILVAGPLPYDMEECLYRAPLISQEIAAAGYDDVRVACEYLADRPALP